MSTSHRNYLIVLLLGVLMALVVSACNLNAAPEGQTDLTAQASSTVPPSRTPQGTLSLPTALPLTSIALTPITFPTSIVQLPSTAVPPPIFQPTQAPVPVSIVILSPLPGNVVAGNVQVLGSAIHPQFLQYQLEYGPDPNPSNLWFPATGGIRNTVLYNLLGIWNTTAVQDGNYQLRLRVYLRDATSLTTVVNNIRIQNNRATPQPSATPSIARPIAAFTQDKSSGLSPLTVYFNNQSTGLVTLYQWNFGDGTGSNELNPQHIYSNPGLYTVTLTVSGPGGASNVSSQINAKSGTPPSAGFTSNKTSGPSPLEIQFTDQSVGTISAYSWNFSDGKSSTSKNPKHTFTVPGTYNVFLTVSGPGGSSSTRREITVLGPTATPVPSITATLFLPASSTPTATGSATPTAIPTETPTATATTEIVMVPTSSPTPTATGTAQPTATPTATALPAPVASFAGAAAGNLTVQFTDTSTSQNGGITGWQWSFGDGGTSTDQNPQHTYGQAGIYNVTLTVSDPGGSNSTVAQVNVAAPILPPVAGFSANPSGNLTVQFTDTSTSSNGGITAWAWNFGDGGTSTDKNPTHTYGQPGNFTVSLTVSDSGGNNATSGAVAVAAPLLPPVASFSSAPAGNLTIQFTDTSTSSNGGITGRLWSFGDGGTSADQNPVHTYAQAGIYNVSLQVTDNGGNNTATNQVNVAAPLVPPAASFSIADQGNQTFGFADTSTSSSGGITARNWAFGDGGTSADQNPQHTYAQAGDYTVTLTVTDNGGQNTATNVVHVAPPLQPPVASFTSADQGNQTFKFTDASTSTSGGITAWAWNFGDNQTGNEQNPSHTYAQPGDYTITLTVTDAGGQNSINGAVHVAAPAQPPTASFTSAPNGNLTVQFTDTSVSTNGGITAWAWNFGDNQTSNDQNPVHTYAAGGDYSVTLTVTDPGGNNSTVMPVSVATPAQPPVAGFSSAPAGDLTLQFTDASTSNSGGITAWAWDFGDGQTSNEQNPKHTYAQSGDVTVSLTVTDNGGSNTNSQPVNVPAPAQSAPSLVEITPILPDVNQNPLKNSLKGIYNNGANKGNHAGVFSVAGDDSAVNLLSTFAPGGSVQLDDSSSGLQSIIDWYNQVQSNGATSFNRASSAASGGWSVGDLLAADTGLCNDGSSRILCELKTSQSSVVIISVGNNDINGDPNNFKAQLQQVVQTATDNGTIPLLLTIQPHGENPAGAQAINQAIIEVAGAYNVPVINLWAQYSAIGNTNQAPGGPGDLTAGSTNAYGINARNRSILSVLFDIKDHIIPNDATP